MVLVLMAFSITAYWVITYLYNVVYLKRYSMGLVDWVLGREEVVNINYYIFYGFLKKKSFKKGESLFDAEICSICMDFFENN